MLTDEQIKAIANTMANDADAVEMYNEWDAGYLDNLDGAIMNCYKNKIITEQQYNIVFDDQQMYIKTIKQVLDVFEQLIK